MVATPLSSFDIADAAAAAAQPCYPRPTADGGSNSFLSIFPSLSHPPARSPSSTLPLVTLPPSLRSSNIISCSSEQQRADHNSFFGRRRGEADGRGNSGVNEGGGDLGVFLGGGQGLSMERSRIATPSNFNLFSFFFSSFFFFIIPSPFFTCLTSFEQIDWWHRNRLNCSCCSSSVVCSIRTYQLLVAFLCILFLTRVYLYRRPV